MAGEEGGFLRDGLGRGNGAQASALHRGAVERTAAAAQGERARAMDAEALAEQREPDACRIAVALCRNWPRNKASPKPAAPFAMHTQVVALAGPNAEAELEAACADGRLRVLAVPFNGQVERAYARSIDFERAIADTAAHASGDADAAHALALLQACVQPNGGSLTAAAAARWAPDVVANALVAANARGNAAGRKVDADLWVAKLASTGFVTRTTDRHGDTWLRLSVPGVGAALSQLASGNADIIGRLSRRARGEAPESLMQRWADPMANAKPRKAAAGAGGRPAPAPPKASGPPFPRGSRLGTAFHLRDLVGRGCLTAVDAPSGTVFRVVR